MMMETLDSGIGSRSPTPDSNISRSQTNSSKVTKVVTHTNHIINNNSHVNTSSSNNANGTYNKTNKSGLEKGDASSSSSSSLSSTATSSSSSTCSTTTTNGGGNNGSSGSGTNHNNGGGSSTGGNNHSNNTSSNNKTYRDYNNRHSSGHGQYKKYGNHQNNHYGYASHNVHYQRYNNGNGHRNYGNKHYHNSSNYHHHNNHNNHYQGQNYHHQYGQQNHQLHHSNGNNTSSTTNNNSNNSSTGSSHTNSHHHQSNHHTNNSLAQNQPTQYYNGQTGASQHHSNNYNQHNNSHHQQQHHRNAPPQVFISSDVVDAFSWNSSRRGGGADTANSSNWSSPNLVDVGGDSATSAVQISLNLSALKQGFYSPSPQNASPAASPSTTDSSDAYSLQDDAAGVSATGTGASTGVSTTSNGVRHNNFSNSSNSCIDTTSMHFATTPGGATILEHNSSLNGTLGPSPVSGGTTGYSYAQFHPFYTYPGSHLNGGRISHHPHHPHHQLINQNLGLLMPADSSYSMGKADSSINSSNGSDKTLEWSDDGTLLSCSSATSNDRGDEYSTMAAHLDNRCSTPDYYYTQYTIASSPAPFTTTNKKRFYNGTGTATGKLSQAVQNQRFHHYPRKMAYHIPGFPREWFEELDPEEYVRAFSKFGEVKERPTALSQTPQCDSLSEGIWLKFVANQQTTETFRRKMELWRDVYRIVRSLNCNSHFKHDPRNFPTFGLQVVGSTMSGFGSNTSDVDMCLLVRGSDVDQRYEAVDKLQVLFGALSATQWLDNAELIYAKVPILKFRDSKRSLEVDLNCNNFVGIRNTHLLYCYSQADWRLKPLVLVVKLWAHYHGINDAKNMTISSYSLVLMVIHFLQCGMEEPVLPILQQSYPDKFSNTTNILNVKINEVLPSWTSKNTESIGNLLIQFLEYYGKKFDYSENAVSVRTGRTIPIKQAAVFKSLKNDPHQWKYLCIEEPFDRTNTARSVYDRDTFEKIVGIFNISYQRLQVSRNLESIFTPISDSDIRANN